MNNNWSNLLFKYVEGTITDAEREELYRQASLSKPKQAQFEQYATQEGIMSQLLELEKIDPDKHWETFKKKLDATRRPAPRLYVVRTAAAALLITILSTVFYYVNLRPASVNAGKLPFTIQNPDAGNEPVLTLYDGSIIKLDSVPDGDLIASGIPFMKKNSALMYVHMIHKDPVRAHELNILSIPHGRQYSITLADSSRIMLNASTVLYFPCNFSGNERWVAMNGEAYFEVDANKAKPFFVNVNNQLYTKVTGTSFNIKAYGENNYIKTTLIEGHLAVTEYGSNRSKTLKRGQQASYTKGGIKVIKDSLNLDEVNAWRKGGFDLEDRSIYEIMEEIGRTYNLKIQYNGEMPTSTFSVTLPKSMPVTEVIRDLSTITQTQIRKTHDTLIVSEK